MAYYLQEVYCIFALSLHKILPLGRLKTNFLCTCLNESSNKDNDA